MARAIAVVLALTAIAACILYFVARDRRGDGVTDAGVFVNNAKESRPEAVAHDNGGAAETGSRRAWELTTHREEADDSDTICLSGRILDSQGAPIADASVDIESRGESVACATGVDGRFATPKIQTFELFNMEIGATGFAWTRIGNIPAPRKSADLGDFVIYKPAPITGKIISETGEPVGGAEIRVAPGGLAKLIKSEYRPRPIFVPLASSNTVGEFDIMEPASNEDIEIVVSKKGFASAVKNIQVDPEQASRVDIVIEKEVIFDGLVVDEHGEEVQGAEVKILGGGEHVVNNIVWPIDSASFQFEGLTGKPEITLRIRRFGFESKVWHPSQIPSDHKFILIRAATVNFQVESPSNTIPQINPTFVDLLRVPATGIPHTSHYMYYYERGDGSRTMTLDRLQPTPDGGWMELERTPSTKWRAVVQFNDYDIGWTEPFDPTSPGEAPPTIPLKMERKTTVRGVVFATDGKPAVDAHVKFTRRLFDEIKIDGLANCAADGTFRIDNLPEGTYEFTGSSPEFEIVPEKINIVAGVDAPIQLHARRAARVHGQLTISGKPPGRAIPVRICYNDPHWRTDAVCITDNDGTFRYGPLQPGQIHFFAGVNKPPRSSYYSFADLAPKPDENTIAGNATANIAAEADVEVNITLP
ncbi:MAG: carboxypeptidase regulatory-like domain-containing protein [Planctomycetes bacterium]|nr:carboxypeptidase regulatory-like domain-containing protein [Planctomycetota bacterium]